MYRASKKLNVLILGSSGVLGKSIYSELKTKKNIKLFNTGLKKRKFDMTNKKKLSNFIKSTIPNIVINCSGIVDIDFCERQKTKAKKINFQIVKNLFLIKKKCKINFFLIHFSTDHIYDAIFKKKSKENSKPKILNYYARTKLMSEKICLKNKDCLVLRTNFFGKTNSNHLTLSDWIIKTSKKNKSINLFNDIYFSPLYLNTLNKIIYKILSRSLFFSGIFNLGSKNGFSKYNFGKKIIDGKGLKNVSIHGILSSNFFKIKRPKNMMMDVSKFEKKFNILLPSLNNEIKRYLRQ
jgi:dTDP-4-dehydrorhamnose reductase